MAKVAFLLEVVRTEGDRPERGVVRHRRWAQRWCARSANLVTNRTEAERVRVREYQERKAQAATPNIARMSAHSQMVVGQSVSCLERPVSLAAGSLESLSMRPLSFARACHRKLSTSSGYQHGRIGQTEEPTQQPRHAGEVRTAVTKAKSSQLIHGCQIESAGPSSGMPGGW